MEQIKVIEGGVSKRENIVMPDLRDDPHDEVLEREYIENLIHDCNDIFRSYDLREDSIPQVEIDACKADIARTIREYTNRDPRVYDYYIYLYDRLSDVVIRPDVVPGEAFTTYVVALLQLAHVIPPAVDEGT